MSYATKAVEAKSKAKDIILAQTAIAIQARIEAATKGVAKAIRSMAAKIRDIAEEVAKRNEANTKRLERRQAFKSALDAVEGITDEEREAALASFNKDREEDDKKNLEKLESEDKFNAETIEKAKKDVEQAKKELAEATGDLEKCNKGDLKISEAEVERLAKELLLAGTEGVDASAE